MCKSKSREIRAGDEKEINSGFTLKIELIVEKKSHAIHQKFQSKNWKNGVAIY